MESVILLGQGSRWLVRAAGGCHYRDKRRWEKEGERIERGGGGEGGEPRAGGDQARGAKQGKQRASAKEGRNR